MTYIRSMYFGNSQVDDATSEDAKKLIDVSSDKAGNNNILEDRKEITRAVINIDKNSTIKTIINNIDQSANERIITQEKSQQIYEKLVYIDCYNHDKRRWAPEWDKLCKRYKGLMINSTNTTTLPTCYRNHIKKTLPILKSNNVSFAKKKFLVEKIKNSIKDHQEKAKKNLIYFDQYKQDVLKFRQDIVKFKEGLGEEITNSQAVFKSFLNYLMIVRSANYSVTQETLSMTHECVVEASKLLEEFIDSIDEFSGINHIRTRVWDVINSELESFLSTKTVLTDDTNKYIA
ncbi:4240_t:CDS:2 [Acaulospora morrowiae]|uniref:4240_t:CDS:1 n=1 Tax=Acaulospora morrowiae TaxID=94023 RepID=A0A9N9HRL6_9GLOM|nr:4240_t:CDS:2 [Acaulospora morrowiae]